MRRGSTIACLGPSLLLILAAGGCSHKPPAPLAELPTHEIGLRRARPKPDAARAERSHAPPSAAWAAVGYRPWRYIVIHHSATEHGNAALFDKAHRARGWDQLGYHFVIDNGRGGPDGRIEVGSRWPIQKWGAHCKTPDNRYNDYGIGVCLVGDFTDRLPSRAQLASLLRLTDYLMRAYGIPPERVIGHRNAPNTSTQCPGRTFHSYIRNVLRPSLARRVASAK